MEYCNSMANCKLSCRPCYKLAILDESCLSSHKKYKDYIETTLSSETLFCLMKYSDKVVVITGASSGIGEESAVEFAKRKSKVVLVSRTRQNLETVAKKITNHQSEILVYPCDVSKKDQVEQMSRAVLDKFGRIDILVNNAGFGIFSSVHESKIEEIESQMATNYFGTVYCTKEFLPKMLEQKSGHIVNVASVAASFGIPGMASYCASKFAMLGFSESLYQELKGTGVGVTVVSPIMVTTN